jgi:mannose-6-phosphate isomerase class I
MSIRSLIEKTVGKNDGIFRLNPVFVPRPFGKAGRRLKLHPDDYYALGLERGSIKERWFASTIAAQNGPLAAPDEGMSYVAVSYESDEKFSLKEAIEEFGSQLIGEELMKKYGGWPMYSKFFDFANPLFHHVHLMFEDAARVGKLGKPESYYFPAQLNNHGGEFNATYFGFDPDTKPEQVKQRLRDYNKGDTRITELSRAYRVELGTGWFTPAGVIHAPASLLTYEPQWNSDVNSVYENVVSGEIYPRDMLVAECPPDRKDDIDYIFGLLDWEKNIDPNYKKHYFRPPVTIVSNKSFTEKWVSYANDYFGAKELTIEPGQSVVIKDGAAYGLICIQGHGMLNGLFCEAPTLLRFGRQSSDEFFVIESAAKKGVTITNQSPVEPMVILKHFGPNHPDMPQSVSGD